MKQLSTIGSMLIRDVIVKTVPDVATFIRRKHPNKEEAKILKERFPDENNSIIEAILA
jgi:hypothetical protein